MTRLLTFRDLAAGSAREEAGDGRLRVFDLHCDTLDRLALHGDFAVPGGYAQHDAAIPAARMSRLDDNDAHISLARTAAFRWCQCFAVFVPDELRGGAAWALLERVRGYFASELERRADAVTQVRDAAGAEGAFAEGRTAALLTVEGLSFLEDDGTAEARLDALADAGVRMATLTWNGRNALGSGHDADEGLSPFGARMVAQLEARGIAVDVSHLNDRGFRDVLDAARRPFAASHSNARAVCGHPRNLADWQLREIAARGGVVGLNYFREFLVDAPDDPKPDDLLRHAEHILNVAGEDALALGSDYDGADVPPWLEPCDRVADLHALLAREFGSEVAAKILYGNAARFFSR